MLKQTSKNENVISKQIQEDIQFLLSNIRARQNGLIFFLERFTSQCKSQQQFITFKQQFLQKQKIYANQVNRIIVRYTENRKNYQEMKQYIRTFWIKVKSIIKVSLDRLRMLKLLNQKIFNRYEEIINIINKNYDEDKDLQQFSCIQNLLKKRNLDALIYGKNNLQLPNSDSKIMKNRSQSALKHSKYSPKPFKFANQPFQNQQALQSIEKLQFQQSNQKQAQIRMKSLNRYRKKKIIMQGKMKNNQKNYKKTIKSLDKYHKCLQGAMQCVLQTNIDKKKTYKQNQQALFDELFNKNIPNHKMISKFLFGACGIAELLLKRKQNKVKKILASKTDKNSKQFKEIEKKIKIKSQKQPKDKEKQKQKDKKKEQSKQRPQSSLTAQIKGIFQQQKRRMIQTTFFLQDKRNSKYRRKIGVTRPQKYPKLVKLIS